jgi:tellurite methyltransferase
MGRGRDLIYLGRNGFRVLGIDLSPAGLEKAKRRAARPQVPIRTQLGDIRNFRLNGTYDVVFSSSTLNHLPVKLRPRRFSHFKSATVRGGIHAVNAFVPQPYLKASPDMEPNTSLYRSGELRDYYRDWQILDSREFGFDCNFSGIPHRHSLDVVIARKPGGARFAGPGLAAPLPREPGRRARRVNPEDAPEHAGPGGPRPELRSRTD